MKTCAHFWSYLAQFFLEWEMFQTKVVEKLKTHFMFSNTFSRKSFRLWDNVEKCGTAREATEDNTLCSCALHAEWLRLQTQNINTYCISTATKVGYAYVPECYLIEHCVSCFNCNWIAYFEKVACDIFWNFFGSVRHGTVSALLVSVHVEKVTCDACFVCKNICEPTV